MSPTSEKIDFQTETRELLQLVVHSLYKHSDIFLRELVSNASDALDRLRFEALTQPALVDGDERLRIRLEVDPEARLLRVIDNGIGMTREEVIANIGTIANTIFHERNHLLNGDTVRAPEPGELQNWQQADIDRLAKQNRI